MAVLEQWKSPKNWEEMSFDYRLFFIYHGCMMALFVVGRQLPIGVLVAIVTTLIAAFGLLSVRNRRKSGWRWPGAGWKQFGGAAGVLALGIFFLGAATPMASPLNPGVFPWFAAGGGIFMLGVLSSLRLVCQTRAEFLSQCGVPILGASTVEPPAESARATEPRWKKLARQTYSVYFVVVWIAAVSFFWKFGLAFRDGTTAPTSERTEQLKNHGRVVYITREERRVVSLLEKSMMVGIPSVFVLGGLLHFVVDVKLFPDTPSLAEKFKRFRRQDRDA